MRASKTTTEIEVVGARNEKWDHFGTLGDRVSAPRPLHLLKMEEPSGGLILQRSLPDWGDAVSLGHLSSTSFPVVVKVVSDAEANGEVGAGRICASLGPCEINLTEAWTSAIGAADAKNLLPPLSCVQHPSGSAVLMPWLGPLVEIPPSGFDFLTALQICRDVAIAVGHCHCRRYLHLSVNPSSIIIDERSGKAVLMGFGKSRLLPSKGCTPSAVQGWAPTHASPEQTGLVGSSVDFRSDLYSLGVTLYQLLTGKLPYPTADHSLGALLHAHVVMEPKPLPQRVPAVVRAVVALLLAKDKEARYSSARSLVDDLDTILNAKAKGLEGMVLNNPPHHMSLQHLTRLYGCEAEAKEVRDSFIAVEDGTLEKSTILFVSGSSGAGKSALMADAFAEVSQRDESTLVLCSGKFAQHTRNSYSAISVCLSDLLVQVRKLSLSHTRHLRRLLAKHTEFMRRASELKVISSEFLAFAAEVTGLQEMSHVAPDCGEKEAEMLAAAFRYVLDLFYSKAWLPVVPFLDDMQWADEASLAFIKALLTQDGTPILMFASYRSNEVTSTHPLAVFRSFLREQEDDVCITDVELQPWSAASTLEALLGMFGYDTLGVCKDGMDEEQQKQALAGVVEGVYGGAELAMLAQFLSTLAAGNPFFTIMLVRGLVDDAAVTYSWEARRWVWSMQNLGSGKYCDNAVDFLLAGMNELPRVDQQVLLVLAVAGVEMPLGLLCDILPLIVAKKVDPLNSSAGVELLWPLIDVGFVTMELPVTVNSQVRFAHDQIEDSALGLFSEAERDRVRLLVAKHIFQVLKVPILATEEAYLASSPLYVDEASLAAIKMPIAGHRLFMSAVGHMVKVSHLLVQDAAVAVLARYAKLCGDVTLAALAFRKAADFYKCSMNLEERLLGGQWFNATGALKKRLWRLHYSMAKSLFSGLFYAEADTALIRCQAHHASEEQLLQVLLDRANLAAIQENYEAAVDLGLMAAAHVGVEIDANVSLEAVLSYIHEKILGPMAESKAAGKGLLGALPPFKEDAYGELLDRTLEAACGSAYLCGKMAIYAYLPAKIVVRAMEKGASTAGTLNAMATLGDSLAGLYGLRREGYELATQGGIHKYTEYMGPALSEYDACRLNHVALVQQWGDSLTPALEWFDQSFERGLKLGKFIYCCYSRAMHLCFCMESAVPLQRIIQLSDERLPFIRRCRLADMRCIMVGVTMAALVLHGGEDEPSPEEIGQFEMSIFDRSLFSQCGALVWLMMACYATSKTADAEHILEVITPAVLESSKGFVQYLEYHWISPLVRSERMQAQGLSEEQRIADYDHIRQCEIELASYASAAPKLWRAKHKLVHAHLMRAMACSPDHVCPPSLEEVLAAFESAANVALEDDLKHVAAFAYMGAMSACARHVPELNMPKAAYALTSRSLLEEWGAFAAASSIEVDVEAQALFSAADDSSSEPIILTDTGSHASADDLPSLEGGRRESVSSGGSGDSHGSGVGEVAPPAGTVYNAVEGLMDLHRLMEAASATSDSMTKVEVYTKFVESLQDLTDASTVLIIGKKLVGNTVVPDLPGAVAALSKFHVVAQWSNGALTTDVRELNSNLEPLALICKTIMAKAPVVVDDAEVDPRLGGAGSLADAYFRNALSFVRSAVALPLFEKKHVVGAIYIEQNSVAGAFNGCTARLRLLTEQLQSALERASSYEALRQQCNDLDKRNREMLEAYAACTRFVPVATLSQLKKKLMKVRPGHVNEVELTVLVADVAALSNAFAGKDGPSAFQFINKLVGALVPPITDNNGTVDKFLGDSPLLALFKSSGDALKAALALQLAMRDFISATAGDYEGLQLTIGLSTGEIVVGCLGTKKRLGVTVVGTCAKTAHTLQKRSVTSSVAILADEATLNAAISDLGVGAVPGWRRMGKVMIAGVEVDVFEVMENPSVLTRRGELEEASRLAKAYRNKGRFQEAVEQLDSGRFKEAFTSFDDLAALCPTDKAVGLLRQKSKQGAGIKTPVRSAQ